MSKFVFKHTLIFEKFWPTFTFLLITHKLILPQRASFSGVGSHLLIFSFINFCFSIPNMQAVQQLAQQLKSQQMLPHQFPFGQPPPGMGGPPPGMPPMGHPMTHPPPGMGQFPMHQPPPQMPGFPQPQVCIMIRPKGRTQTQPPVDRWFRPGSIVVNNDICLEPDGPPVNQWLGLKSPPKYVVLPSK